MRFEENKERKERVNKMAVAAVGVVAGGTLLKQKGGIKYLSKAFGDMSTTMKKVSKDINLTGRKGLTADGISDIFRKNISNDDSTWKLARRDTIQKVDFSKRGLISELKYLDNLSGKFNNIKNTRLDSEIREDVMNTLSDRFKDIKDRDETFMKDLYNLVDKSLKKQNVFFEKGAVGEYKALVDEFKNAAKGTTIAGKEEEIADVLKTALENSDDIKKNMDNISKETENQIQDKFLEHIKEKYAPGKGTDGEERAATLNDVWEALQAKKAESAQLDTSTDEMMEYIQQKLEKDPSLGDLVVDKKSFRMDANNQFYSIEDLRTAKDNMIEGFSETIPGKLFAVRNVVAEAGTPTFEHFAKGTFDPGLAELQGGKDLLKEDLFYIGDKFYKMAENGLEHFKEADGRKLISGRDGNKFGLLNRMAGNTDERYQTNKLAQKLDIFTKGGGAFKELGTIFTKFKDEDWQRNLFKRFTSYDPVMASEEQVRQFHNDIRLVSKAYNEGASMINEKSINALRNRLTKDATNILETLDSKDPLEAYKALGLKTTNGDLDTLIKRIESNPTLKNTMTRAAKTASGDKHVIKYDEIIKREIFKEALFKDISTSKAKHQVSGYAATLSRLEDAGLTNTELEKAKNILNWGIIQERGGAFASDIHAVKTYGEKLDSYGTLSKLMNGKNNNAQEDAFLKEFRESVLQFGKDNTSVFQKTEINNNLKQGYDRNQWMTTSKSVSPLELIEGINNTIKNNVVDESIMKFGRQLTAGRGNMKDVSDLTMLPYHFFNRLITPLESFGLGASNASTGNTLELVKFLGLKRILPMAGVGFGLAYLNYESENLTGTSMEEAYQNAKAQFGVGVRTVLSPFDDSFKKHSVYNPMSKYIFGEYKDKDEYLDYLEYGYDPVRKGRFWSFGSASEFRGGKISYWEPNKLRQAHSNYRDIAIYGSSEERWKHSIIPTLRHPFSTLRYLSNPYWLEEKHYEDRPYPVSGKMFTEGTPWGAILNPTIGELIKPQKKMHQEHLQGTGLDVRSIIAAKNQEVKDRSQENRLLRIDESGLTPMMFSPESMPTLNEAIYSIKVDNGQITSAGFEGQQYAETMDAASTAVPADLAAGQVGEGKLAYGVGRLKTTNTFENTMAANWISGIAALASSGAIEGGTAISMIREVNEDIKFRSESRPNGEWFEKANMHTNPYRRESFNKKQDYLDSMIAFDTKKDYVNDMIYSAKQLSGMYGFLFDQILPASHGYKLEQAGSMASFSRQFWDESVGGMGGNFMEIARRFFPHENHNVTQINPIRNTQEEWMPIRFQTGDPYTKVPKGEARLPGAGYEALNKLHSDKYGRYGAFDRYKILSDIAPLSEEYKIWKKIAKAEVKDPFLKKEMAAIEDRVKEQVKEHDFYNYKFLGKNMKETTAVVEEVSNTGKFKVMGSDQEFTMAGIKVLKDEEGNSQVHNYLKAGMRVNLKYEDNDFNKFDSTGKISAIVDFSGRNLNDEMFREGAAKEKETKETLADEIFNLSGTNMFMGHVFEAVAHAPIPFVHNKFMRVDSSIESYKKEQVYGTPYSTWDHPIKGFIKPAFQQAWAAPPVHQAIGVAAWGASEYFRESGNKTASKLADTAFAFANPGGFAGGVIGALPKMSLSDKGIWNARNGARIGATIGLAGYAFANTTNPLLSVANFAALGMAAQEQLQFKGINRGKAALIGAGVGLALSGLNPESDITNLSKKYIPEDTKKKWEIEEYYDRLEYIKYTNLFHKAAREAKSKEGVDIHRIINQYERNKDKNAKLIEKLENQKKKADRMIDEKARDQLIATIDGKINDLLTPIQYLQAGEYTKAALAYKKAADTTIYGLSEDATTADVLRALPKYDRDYFLDFANEKDPKKRKKILQYVSPYKAKALKTMWGEETDDLESNYDFFNNHNLPNMFWSGWQPQVDLDNVKMKTIENEGMLLSDFGMYDSSMNDPAAIAAPEIKDMGKGTNPLSLQTNMLSLLNGVGFQNVDVSVESTRTPGIQMITNVTRVATYNIGNSVSSTLSNLIL